MGVPTSEVGYTPAMPRREDHEVHIGHVVALEDFFFLFFFFNGRLADCRLSSVGTLLVFVVTLANREQGKGKVIGKR